MSQSSEEGDGLDAGASDVIVPTEGGLKPVAKGRERTARDGGLIPQQHQQKSRAASSAADRALSHRGRRWGREGSKRERESACERERARGLLRRDLNLLQLPLWQKVPPLKWTLNSSSGGSITDQKVCLARLAVAHCESRCSTASVVAFSAPVLWHHLVLAMAERDDGGRSRQPHGVRRDATRLARPSTRVTGLSTGVDSTALQCASPSLSTPVDLQYLLLQNCCML
jgi:hypothetical protein